MNNIFRNIRENKNLDFLEESDDEDTFQNISDDKFISSIELCIMECIYLPKFKKWLPQTIIKNKDIITYNKLKGLSL